MMIIALEGPSCSGKSFLAQRLPEALFPVKSVSFPCYVDFVGPSVRIPEPAVTSEDEEHNFRFFLEVEENRAQLVRSRIGSLDIAIIDRSIFTLLAHAKTINRPINHLELDVMSITSSYDVLWPELVIYVDLPQHLLYTRYPERRGVTPELFLDDDYNQRYRSYFETASKTSGSEVRFLDATDMNLNTVTKAADLIRQYMSGGRR